MDASFINTSPNDLPLTVANNSPNSIGKIIRHNQGTARIYRYAYRPAPGFAIFPAKTGNKIDWLPGRSAITKRNKNDTVAHRI